MEHLLGAHTSTSGGVSKAVERAEKLGFTAMQIFTKNNNRWAAKPLDKKKLVNLNRAWNTQILNLLLLTILI